MNIIETTLRFSTHYHWLVSCAERNNVECLCLLIFARYTPHKYIPISRNIDNSILSLCLPMACAVESSINVGANPTRLKGSCVFRTASVLYYAYGELLGITQMNEHDTYTHTRGANEGDHMCVPFHNTLARGEFLATYKMLLRLCSFFI